MYAWALGVFCAAWYDFDAVESRRAGFHCVGGVRSIRVRAVDCDFSLEAEENRRHVFRGDDGVLMVTWLVTGCNEEVV